MTDSQSLGRADVQLIEVSAANLVVWSTAVQDAAITAGSYSARAGTLLEESARRMVRLGRQVWSLVPDFEEALRHVQLAAEHEAGEAPTGRSE